PESLVRLAHLHGVDTRSPQGEGEVAQSTVLALLAALGVDGSPSTAQIEIEHAEDDVWRRMLPWTVVLRQGSDRTVPVHVPHGEPAEVWVELESGERRPL